MGFKNQKKMIDRFIFFPNRFNVDVMHVMTKQGCEQSISVEHLAWVHTIYNLGYFFIIANQIEEL